MLREIVDVRVIGSDITSIILYKTVMNMYMKNTHNNASVLKALGGPANTKTKLSLEQGSLEKWRGVSLELTP